MQKAVTETTVSLRPYFRHRRMWPKWTATVVLIGLVVVFTRGLAWVWLPIGWAGFLLSEYALHRWFLHAPKDSWRRGFRNVHMHHHKDPSDLDYLFLPWQSTVLLAVATMPILIVSWSPGVVVAFLLGNMGATLYYECIHFIVHQPGRRLKSRWARGLRKHHLAHHLQDAHSRYGIASRSLDAWLRTAGKTPSKGPTSDAS